MKDNEKNMLKLEIGNWKLEIPRQGEAGFTLIELLIVVAIIGILSALLMTNFIGVRQRARDAQRKSDVRQIQSALELWRADAGSYPLTASFPNTCNASLTNNTSTYMQKVPCDPLTATHYTYTSSDGTTYKLITCLENKNDSQLDTNTGGQNVAPCDGTTNFSFTLTNP